MLKTIHQNINQNSLITEPLGLYGWNYLEPVILAALATEFPILLIGKHGCAKSFLLERLAQSLNLVFRCYNASLINYDDLVGIPIPTKDNKSLEYISNKSSIWESEVVFIDEINRTKPELQNKLFPIIYDKRIQGQTLDKLKYRWAAMNPPCIDEEYEDNVKYLGTMPLDPALADRFPFIISVPDWDNLTETQQAVLLSDQFEGKHQFSIDIMQLIEDTKIKYKEIVEKYSNESSNYIVALMNVLQKTIGYVSTRRATMLQQTLLAIHSARVVLAKYTNSNEEIKLEDSAYLALPNTLPNTAIKELNKSIFVNIVAQAWNISQIENSDEKKLLLLKNPIQRLSFAIKNIDNVTISTLSNVITRSISEIYGTKKRAVCLATYLAIRRISNIPATVIETIVTEIRSCFEPKEETNMAFVKNTQIAHQVSSFMNKEESNKELQKYRNNLLNSFLPDGYSDINEVKELFYFFNNLWKEFDL